MQQLISDRLIVSWRYHVGLDLIKKMSLRIRSHHYFSGMRIPVDRFVIEGDHARRKENKDQNQRDHDVVMESAPLMLPQNVRADCSPDGVHGQGRAGCSGRDFCSLQVY